MPAPAELWRRSLGVGVAVVISSAGLAGCADRGSNQRAGATVPSSSGSSVAVSPTAGATPTDPGSPLAQAVTFDSGLRRFEPPPAGYQPLVTAAQAYSTYIASGLYSSASEYSQPTISLASFTDFSQGPITATGAIAPQFVKVPVWTITFENYPEDESGGAVIGSAKPSPGRTVSVDIVVFVSAETGKGIETLSDLPDASPQPVPNLGANAGSKK